MYLVAGCAERLERLEVLERHRLLVDVAGGAEDALQRLAEALGLEDRRLALALGAQDRGLLLALGDVDVACRVPSDSVITARRLRSAESIRFIASWTSRGGMISRISTVVTLPPQRSVCSSSLARRTSLICSRLDSTSSSRMSPMTARRVVVAMPCSAPAKFCDVHDAAQRVDDLPVDQEVDVDRRVVLGDRGLARDLDELLAQVDLDRPVDERDQEAQARARGPGSVRSCPAGRRPSARTVGRRGPTGTGQRPARSTMTGDQTPASVTVSNGIASSPSVAQAGAPVASAGSTTSVRPSWPHDAHRRPALDSGARRRVRAVHSSPPA